MLSDIYKNKGNFKQALDAYKNHITFRDSLINEEKKSEIVRKELSFDYERKALKARAEAEKNEALSKAEIERQKLRNNAFMGAGVIVLLSGITGFVGYKRRRDLERKSIQTQNELQVNKTELRVLRLQMDPHFIFNSLNSVSDYMLKNDIETADRYLTRFARLMRQTLEQSASSEVTLEDDLNALRTYLDLEQLRLKGKMTYTLSVDENINSSAVLVPSLILQPFIENSIVHGIGPKEGEGKINIKISREGNLLNCMLEDDGVGRNQNVSNNGHKSYGMQITQTRIDLLNKMHNSHGGIKLTDLQPGLRVEVKIPYIEDNV
jgi:LytS/YehU family sensor histidine kinase